VTVINFNLADYGPRKSDSPPQTSTQFPEQEFADELERFGLDINGRIETGTIKRVDHQEKRGRKTGWYIFYGVDPVSCISGGMYGDWRLLGDDKLYWSSHKQSDVTPSQWDHYQKRVKEAKEKADAEKKQRQDDTAARCYALLDGKQVADKHPYLDKKRIHGHDVYSDDDGALLVPMNNRAGELRNVQRIYANGDKYFTEGGQVLGCFHLLGDEFKSPVFICEGFATGASIHKITNRPVIVAFNTSNLKPVAEELRETYPDLDLIFAADNDRNTDGNPGVTKATAAAEAVGNAIVRVPQFPSVHGTDFNDLYVMFGADAVREQLEGLGERATGVQISWLYDVDTLTKPDWLIEGYLLRDSLAGMYGTSGTGKSFMALDIGLSIASGHTWHDKEILDGGPVLYICGEGKAGVARRCAAWCHDRDVDIKTVQFALTHHAVHFLDSSQLADLTQKITALQGETGQKFSAVIIDTLNRNYGSGDENKTSDMTQFVSGMDKIRKIINGVVLVIHHTGVMDDSRARGSGALKASLDTELEVTRRCETDPIRLLCRKLKDGELAAPQSFELKPVIYARDDDNTPIGSVVLQKIEDLSEEDKPKAEPKAGSPRAVMLDLLRSEVAHCDQVAIASGKENAEICKVDARELGTKFRKAIKEAGRKNPTTAYNEVISGQYFGQWVTNEGAWLIINRDEINA
jgi:putative DNA primase/helicase